MIAPCPQAISAETLSAWRSQLLPVAEQRALDAHIADCAACKRRLRRFDHIAQALQERPLMPSQDAVWRGVRAEIMKAPGKGNAMTNTNRSAILGTLATLAVIVLGLATFILIRPGSSPTTTTTPPGATATHAHGTATPAANSPVPSATSVTQLKPTSTWTFAAAIPDAKDIAFAQSDPLTGYACGNAVPLTRDVMSHTLLQLSVTHDGGRTWSTTTTAMGGASCHISINPTNARDLLMQPISCPDCDAQFGYRNYRSIDGGAHWIELTLPHAQTQAQPLGGGNLVFVGDALYAIALYAPGDMVNTPVPLLMVSHEEHPFTWIANIPIYQDPIYQAKNAVPNLTQLYAVGSTITAELFDPSCAAVVNSSNVCVYLQSSNSGQSWTRFTRLGQSDISSISPLGDSQTLSGFEDAGIVQSTDGGRTWRNYAAYPPNSGSTLFVNEYFTTPDGTMFYGGANSNGVISVLSLNGTTWRMVANDQANHSLRAVGSDAQGHPLAIWEMRTGGENILGAWYRAA
jgi:hypothetical protein